MPGDKSHLPKQSFSSLLKGRTSTNTKLSHKSHKIQKTPSAVSQVKSDKSVVPEEKSDSKKRARAREIDDLFASARKKPQEVAQDKKGKGGAETSGSKQLHQKSNAKSKDTTARKVRSFSCIPVVMQDFQMLIIAAMEEDIFCTLF